jgi:hypothetical protein
MDDTPPLGNKRRCREDAVRKLDFFDDIIYDKVYY